MICPSCVAVVPLLSETRGLSALEAMASARLVVTSRVGGILERLVADRKELLLELVADS
jgi:glycosyltransferase involved in cell wall biosynthesis